MYISYIGTPPPWALYVSYIGTLPLGTVHNAQCPRGVSHCTIFVVPKGAFSEISPMIFWVLLSPSPPPAHPPTHPFQLDASF